jgi:hypothetical protein
VGLACPSGQATFAPRPSSDGLRLLPDDAVAGFCSSPQSPFLCASPSARQGFRRLKDRSDQPEPCRRRGPVRDADADVRAVNTTSRFHDLGPADDVPIASPVCHARDTDGLRGDDRTSSVCGDDSGFGFPVPIEIRTRHRRCARLRRSIFAIVRVSRLPRESFPCQTK